MKKNESKLKMVLTSVVNEKLLESLVQKERLERLAAATSTSEVISKLNLSVDNLPQKCQELFGGVRTAQTKSQITQLDPVTISLCQSRVISENMDDEYEILKLRQKNKEVQVKIDRNTKLIEQLIRDLAQSRQSLASLTPNPETVQDYCRQIKQKVASYEENYERAKAKFSTLAVPEHVMLKSLSALAVTLAELTEQETALRRSAEDIALVNQARHALLMLKK